VTDTEGKYEHDNNKYNIVSPVYLTLELAFFSFKRPQHDIQVIIGSSMPVFYGILILMQGCIKFHVESYIVIGAGKVRLVLAS
jgi:hypothetical protein